MALKLSVGLQKKVGLPDYGSLAASCHVEFEIDRSLLDHDLDGFHQQVAGAFVACRQAVNDQLAQHSAQDSNQQPIPRATQQPTHSSSSNGNGHSRGNAASNGNGHFSVNAASNGNGHSAENGHGTKQEAGTATQSQVRAIFAIARRQRIDPLQLVRERFSLQRLDDLSIREASSLIDELKRLAVEASS